jgi:CheY-like chemotaxis protein
LKVRGKSSVKVQGSGCQLHNEILLAEDSRDVQIVFRNTLKKCGVVNPLVTLEDGHATVAYLNGDPPFKDRGKNGVPGVLFLDLNMPDSEEVLNWIQNRPGGKEGVLVIVMSPLDSVGEVSHAYELGADTFLSEPFTPPEMLHLVDTFPGQWIRTAPAATLRSWQHLTS